MYCANCREMRAAINMFARKAGPELVLAANRAVSEIRDIVCSEIDCYAYKLRVRAFGSVFNGTHGPGSDVDVAITPMGCEAGLPSRRVLSPPAEVVCEVLDLRSWLAPRLRRAFGAAAVEEKPKALAVRRDGRVPMDVVVLIPRHWHYETCASCSKPKYSDGFEIRSTGEKEQPIATWPEQHRVVLSRFDAMTGSRYRPTVRALKVVLKRSSDPWVRTLDLPPVLIESLFASVPVDRYIGPIECCWCSLLNVVEALHHKFERGEAVKIMELSGMRLLFDQSQTWNITQVGEVIARLHMRLSNHDISLFGNSIGKS